MRIFPNLVAFDYEVLKDAQRLLWKIFKVFVCRSAAILPACESVSVVSALSYSKATCSFCSTSSRLTSIELLLLVKKEKLRFVIQKPLHLFVGILSPRSESFLDRCRCGSDLGRSAREYLLMDEEPATSVHEKT